MPGPPEGGGTSKWPCLAPLFIRHREFLENTSSLRVEKLSSAIVVSLNFVLENTV